MGSIHAGYRKGETGHVPTEETLDKIWNWLTTYVAPSLKMIAEIGKLDNRNYIGLLVENGKMNATQQRIYDDYRKSFQLQNNDDKGEESF